MAIEYGHQVSHLVDNDPEDFIFLCLTRREVVLVATAAMMLVDAYPCLEDDIREMEKKASAVVRVQKPEWSGASPDDD
jgi:hypothetical protein